MQISKHMVLAFYNQTLRSCCFCIAAAFFLVACSPKLDWRVVQSPQERYTALFPGKPDKIQRRVTYQDQELLQSLEALKIDDDIYSISATQIPVGQSLLLPTLMEQLQGNVLARAKSLGGEVIVEDVLYLTADKQKQASKEYWIQLKSKGTAEQWMRVRWITRVAPDGSIWIYQVSVLHAKAIPSDAKTFLSKEEYSNFFDEFYPE
ncbi:hypothetical protein [Polynucleobacter sp. AP-Melu-500A-A1]|uniref:hypothetical protein n=1 Tax=Polynucleobacter sp. AP-Melu-500A-A1 TaxID=2576929 RepID=UPI002101FE94|nr:hypothetical protein [Polynucleobacter sp. AP-Melu-500A-A1]